jgi:hypothetical protein
MTWPGDGPPCEPRDIRERIDRLIDPHAKLRVRTIWTFQHYFRFRPVSGRTPARAMSHGQRLRETADATGRNLNTQRSV